MIPAEAKDTDQVEILRHRKNQPAGSINMTRAEARAHYAAQLRAGFVKV